MASVELRGISKAFGDTSVLHGIDLSIRDGEFLTLVGPSGCGKSTLIRIIAGLEAQDQGSVALGGTPVDDLRPHERRVAMVFQSYALYPHMTVRENIGLPLVLSRLRLWERVPVLRLLSRRRRSIMPEVDHEVEATARQLHIEHLLERRPAQLSGGEQQRVALGRAMVRRPRAFLMDEPLTNLDFKLRVEMRSELKRIHSELNTTLFYVTNDQTEAMSLADRIAVLNAGVLQQVGTPEAIYDHPVNHFVASFIGNPRMNFLRCVLRNEATPMLAGVGGAWQLAITPEQRDTIRSR